MRANKEFVEIELIEAEKGFAVADSNVVEGKVVSVGEEVLAIKKGYKVLFDTNKSLQYPIKGKNHYFVREETILAYESNR